MKHWHHIIPKHVGGTDDPSNLVLLTVEEHAEAHKKLYDTYGRWQDYIAWKGLLGITDKKELIREFLSLCGKKGNSSRPTNKGKKYTYKNSINPNCGTKNRTWYHDPNSNLKKCLKPEDPIPLGWKKGQGKKAINPGFNFWKNKNKSLGGDENRFDIECKVVKRH